MPNKSSIHYYSNWAKERIDEMDAIISSFEAKAGQAKAELKAEANKLAVDLKKRRDGFQAKVKELSEAGETAARAGKAQLEAQWRDFESQVEDFFGKFGKEVAQQRATFEKVAVAQINAWRESAEKLHQETANIGTKGRAEIDVAIKRMKADATEAEARLQKMKQAGENSWKAMNTALSESRQAFDRANKAAWDAMKQAGSHPAA